MTFPFAVRFLLAKDYKVITAVLGIAMRIIFAWQRRQARREGVAAAKNAAVVFVQRFGGALNCNVHVHALVPDGRVRPRRAAHLVVLAQAATAE